MSETSPITEQANPETELARDRCSPEDLPPDALQTIPRTEPVVQVLEQINAELENLSVGAGRTQVEEEEEDEVHDSGRLVQPDAGGSSSGGLERIPSMTRGFPFPVSYLKPVGQAFEDNRKMIWSWLMNDEISTIGIFGMGGIGKTTILKHIHNELLQRPDISRHVYWVNVPQDLSIYRLQNLIAKHLDLDLSSEYDILPRAAKLSEELRKKQEWILILDDLWESFELSAVGIPVPLKGCKVIFTTRSDVVCQRMGSQVITKVRPLSEREAWTLFMKTLGHGIALSPEVELIAVYIARECAGLPLGIITLAGSLRGVDDLHEWRRTLKKLKELKSGDKGDEVFRMLRLSYDRLDDVALQQCLLYCASFPEDYIIKREELIFYLIDEGIIQKMWSREATFDKGHAMLDRLENVGLLQRIDGGRAVKMHDLVRDMAKEQRRKEMEMAGSNIDRFWNYVEQTNDGILKCQFCGHLFAKGSSISRIKWHLSGQRGHAVAICGQVPKQVQEAAFLAMHCGNSTHKTMGKRRKGIEMVGSNIERFWNHVEKMNDGSSKCKFCGHRFAKDTSLSRIKWHFSGERGHGVAICGKVPKQVQEAAFLAMLGGNSTHKTMGKRRKGIEMAGSNIEQFWNHVEQMNDGSLKCMLCGHQFAKDTPLSRTKLHFSGERGRGVAICGQVPKQVQEAAFLSMHGGNSTHKTMGQRRKRIEMAPLKSGWTGAISAHIQEQNNVDMAQQREPLLTGELEQANDVTGEGIELPSVAPDDQDELKKLKGSKSKDMIDDLKSGWTGTVSASAKEQNNVGMAQQQEPLLTGELEQANDVTGEGIELPSVAPDDQDELKKLKGSKSRDMVDDLKSGWTGAVSASAKEQNNVDIAQQQEPLLKREMERENDLTGGGIELPRDAPDDQDELKKLKGSKSRDMIDGLKSGWTGTVSASAKEQSNVDMAQQQEPLLKRELKRANDLTGGGIELPRDAPDDQDEFKKLKGSKSRDMIDDLKSGWTGTVSASAKEQNNVDMAQQQEPLLKRELKRANDLTGEGIELPRDAPDDRDELKKLKESKSRDMVDDFKSGWTLLMTNLFLEIASAVFDQLGYALVGMVLAFVALLLPTAELLIHMARKERMSLLPIFHRPSTSTFTIVEYFGLVGAVWQCFYSTVEYAYARQKKDNPIKMCLLPFIFLLCVVISKLIKTEFIDESA